MSLTYDQKSEIHMAFDEAFVPQDRRRDARIPLHVDAEICLWKRNRQHEPFGVRIEDFSPNGVGIVHTESLSVQSEYLFRVPRREMSELVVLLTVVRCRKVKAGLYDVGLEISSVMDRTNMGQLYDALKGPPRKVTPLTKVLFCLFGIAGIGASILIN